MLCYIQKAAYKIEWSHFKGWVGDHRNRNKHTKMSTQIIFRSALWVIFFLSFSFSFFVYSYFLFFSMVNMFSFRNLKNVKWLINKMPPPHPTRDRQRVAVGRWPLAVTSALPAQHNQRAGTAFLEGVWAILILRSTTAQRRPRELYSKNSETNSAGPGHPPTAEAQGPAWAPGGEWEGRGLDSGSALYLTMKPYPYLTHSRPIR